MTEPAQVAMAQVETARAIETARVRLCYLWRHRRLPDLARPTRFTELVQRRKLHDRDPRTPALADKLAVKAFVADRLGTDWITPTLWSGATLPLDALWPRPFALKSRHGCRQIEIVRPGDDWTAVRARAERWTRRPYGAWLDEWLYDRIPRGLLVEPFIGNGLDPPLDYKLFAFGGRVEYIQVHSNRGADHRWVVMDRDWRRVSTPTWNRDPPPPQSLPAMIEGAEALAAGFDFIRVDLYEVASRPRFGELTFYPGSGLDRFDPISLDAAMGEHWLRARS